jgi:sporulation protein YlmC with PRC-barrel domain
LISVAGLVGAAVQDSDESYVGTLADLVVHWDEG